MKKLFTLVFTVFIITSLNAQNHNLTTSNGSTVVTNDTKVATVVDENLLVLKESEHDFGKIPQGKPVTHVFDVFNKSNNILKISNVVASCGCTTPEWIKDEAVGPGNGTKITVGYNAAAEGPFNKQITITYNDNQVKVFNIKGEVWKTPVASAPENKGLNDLKN